MYHVSAAAPPSSSELQPAPTAATQTASSAMTHGRRAERDDDNENPLDVTPITPQGSFPVNDLVQTPAHTPGGSSCSDTRYHEVTSHGTTIAAASSAGSPMLQSTRRAPAGSTPATSTSSAPRLVTETTPPGRAKPSTSGPRSSHCSSGPGASR